MIIASKAPMNRELQSAPFAENHGGGQRCSNTLRRPILAVASSDANARPDCCWTLSVSGKFACLCDCSSAATRRLWARVQTFRTPAIRTLAGIKLEATGEAAALGQIDRGAL